MIKRKIVAFLKYPYMLYDILRSQDVYTGGLGIVFVGKQEVVKIRIPLRVKEVSIEENKRAIVSIASLEYEQKKFIYFNKRSAKVSNNRVVLEKIEALPLSVYLDQKEKFLSFFEKSIQKLHTAYREDGYYHCDFHMDNILTDKSSIYFIDFDFEYIESLKGLELEADILKFLFYFKKYYLADYQVYFLDLKSIILNYYSIENLQKTAILMKHYLQGELNELF